MKASKHILQVALSVTFGLAIIFSATTANAGKRAGDPPFGQRDVIANAAPICALATEPDALGLACDLFDNSNGTLDITSKGCDGDASGNALVEYSLRNCEKNRDSLMRYAASAVLSIDDWIARGKESQLQSAAGYLCGYVDKYMLLQGAGKLSGADLAADAETIVTDYLWLSCVDI